MSKPVKVTYTGGFDEAAVLLPSGDYRTVKRGEQIEVLASDAEHLSPVDWTGPNVGKAFEPKPEPEATPTPGDDDK